MSFWDKIKMAIMRLMSGRYGADELGMFCLIVGLLLDMLDGFLRTGILSLLGFALYGFAIYRMFSRQIDKRVQENAKYQAKFNLITTKLRQFWVRTKNRKEYKYFRCPGCHSLMRLKRGSGEKHIVCPKCKKEFDQKA